jgi:acetylornithine deacetylase
MRIPIPAIKMGPGDSGRSHKADEFVTVEEIRAGIDGYVRFINNLNL